MGVFWQVVRWLGQGVISVSGLAAMVYSIAVGVTDSKMWDIPWEGWAIGGLGVLSISLIYVVIRLSIRLYNVTSPEGKKDSQIRTRISEELEDRHIDVNIITTDSKK